MAFVLILSTWQSVLASQIDIPGPTRSQSFGTDVVVLTNGNFVVTDPYYDIPGGATDVGAVYLYNGATHVLISTLTGSTSGDQVGLSGVTVLSNGHYVVTSPNWDNGSVTDAGAVTWGDSRVGVHGVVSSSNSLVGSIGYDQVGLSGVTALGNGNYVVTSPDWDNGSVIDAGAVTWGDGTVGVSGEVNSNNSLVGSTNSDQVGLYGVRALSGGNYVVNSLNWDNGSVTDAGAVTWGDGRVGVIGAVSQSNSLVGGTSGDHVGNHGVTALSNGNYVVRSSDWDNSNVTDAGAVTWGDGTVGVLGLVNSSNSLVGSTSGDRVGNYGVTALCNGNYVVRSPWWDNGSVADAGAVTWGDGTVGVRGKVSSSNSLVGSTRDDRVGGVSMGGGVTALSNGNYVVSSPGWNNGSVTDAGAVTWGDGMVGARGEVSSSNSLVGSTSGDQVGYDGMIGGVTALSNGNYVVSSPGWDNGSVTNAGAVTWGDGTVGIHGEVNSSNSLVGSTGDDEVGDYEVTALRNGNYVVSSLNWNNGSATRAGAVTWGDGTVGVHGEVSSSNSLVGSTNGDQVGFGTVTALSNGNYVVSSPRWDNGGVADAGAVTWGDGTVGVHGVVSSSNSLVGSTSGDQVGYVYYRVLHIGTDGVRALSNGNYVVSSPWWDNGNAIDAGAATWGDGAVGVRGVVSSTNSLIGSTSEDYVGRGGVTKLRSGHYVVSSPGWSNVDATGVGAVTWGDGAIGVRGEVGSNRCNSVLGATPNRGYQMHFTYDEVNQQLIVVRPADNLVTLFKPCITGMDIQGNGVSIANGDSTPSTSDGTNLGATLIGSSLSQNFSIANMGRVDSIISSISLSGTHASDFSISVLSTPLTVAANSNVTFTVLFTPSAMGVHTATVSIVIDELVQTPYTFAVQGIWGASQYQIITGTAGNGHGSVNLNPLGGTYTEGTVVTVNATADTGSHFVKWSGSCTDTKDCLLTLHDNKIVIATFAQLPNGLAVGLIRNTPDPIQSGDTITWEVVLTNTGEITLTVETISATHTSRVQTNDVAHEDRAEVKCATPFALGIGDVERCTLLDQITEAAGSHVDFQVSVTGKSVGMNLPVSASVISQIDVVSPSEDQIYLPLLNK